MTNPKTLRKLTKEELISLVKKQRLLLLQNKKLANQISFDLTIINELGNLR